jgi:hypothetical protein
MLGVGMLVVSGLVTLDMKSFGHFCYKPPVSSESSACKSVVGCTKNLIIANSRVNASTINRR